MGATRRNETIEALWASIMPKNMSFDYQSDDELLKLSLLLKSTQVLVTGLRQKHLTASSQLESVTKQLTSADEKKKLYESEMKALQKDLIQLKVQVQSAEDKSMAFQKEAEAVTAKYERLQTKITSEVESRLMKMFTNCMRQNKAATVQDMMTQMYPETQLPQSETDHSVSKHFAPEQLVKQSSTVKNVDVSSPEVIQATPPNCKETKEDSLKARKEKLKARGLLAQKVTSTAENSAPSSPDIIAGTPTPKVDAFKKIDNFKKKDNKKRKEIFGKLFSSDYQETESELETGKESVIYAKDTQDMDEFQARPVLRDNIIVPETFNPGSSDLDKEENAKGVSPKKGNRSERLSSEFTEKGNERKTSGNKDATSQKDKENERHSSEFKDVAPKKRAENERLSPVFKDNQTRKIDSSTSDALPFSTPKRPPRPRDRSPILGNSGSKKNNSRSFNTPALDDKSKKSPESETKRNRQINSSLSADNDVSIEYRMTKSGKVKRSVQPSIKNCLNNSRSRLSLPKKSNKQDISKQPCFNGGERSAKDVSLDITQLSEGEQIDLALARSRQETSLNSILEDSDATLFIPPEQFLSGKQGGVSKEDSINVQSTGNPIHPSNQKIKSEEESVPILFEPIYASTEREECPTAKRTNPTQSIDLGRPLFSSTEKNLMENSALDLLAQHLEEEEEEYSDDSAHLDTSYDRPSKKSSSPDYAYKGPTVRKKAERRALPGMECTQCGKYFAMAFGDASPNVKKKVVDSCSRHRDRHERVRSPMGYWDPGLPSTQFMRERQELPTD